MTGIHRQSTQVHIAFGWGPGTRVNTGAPTGATSHPHFHQKRRFSPHKAQGERAKERQQSRSGKRRRAVKLRKRKVALGKSCEVEAAVA